MNFSVYPFLKAFALEHNLPSLAKIFKNAFSKFCLYFTIQTSSQLQYSISMTWDYVGVILIILQKKKKNVKD